MPSGRIAWARLLWRVRRGATASVAGHEQAQGMPVFKDAARQPLGTLARALHLDRRMNRLAYAPEDLVTSDAPSRDRDPETDLDKVSARAAGMVAMGGLAIGLILTAP